MTTSLSVMTMARSEAARLKQFWKKIREKPSPTCRDPKQLDLVDQVRRKGFEALDRAIEKKMASK